MHVIQLCCFYFETEAYIIYIWTRTCKLEHAAN